MQPTSIQLSLSQIKADPSIAWARLIILIGGCVMLKQRNLEKDDQGEGYIKIESSLFQIIN